MLDVRRFNKSSKVTNTLPAQRFGEFMSTADVQRALLNFCAPIEGGRIYESQLSIRRMGSIICLSFEVIFCVSMYLYVFFCVSRYFLCCSMYFCVVLNIVRFVSFSALFVCKCVLNHWHRVATQLQLTDISYHIKRLLTSQERFNFAELM